MLFFFLFVCILVIVNHHVMFFIPMSSRLPQWLQYSSCGDLTDDIDIHNCAVTIWAQLIKKIELPASWRTHFKTELDLLDRLSHDRDAVLHDCGFAFVDPKGRFLELFHGSRPVEPEIGVNFVVRVQRLGRLLRIISAMIWPECYDEMLKSSDIAWPEASCMSRVVRSSSGHDCSYLCYIYVYILPTIMSFFFVKSCIGGTGS